MKNIEAINSANANSQNGQAKFNKMVITGLWVVVVVLNAFLLISAM